MRFSLRKPDLTPEPESLKTPDPKADGNGGQNNGAVAAFIPLFEEALALSRKSLR